MHVTFARRALLAVLVGAPAAHAANLVTNGSFETGDTSGWSIDPAATGSAYGVGSVFPGYQPEGDFLFVFSANSQRPSPRAARIPNCASAAGAPKPRSSSTTFG